MRSLDMGWNPAPEAAGPGSDVTRPTNNGVPFMLPHDQARHSLDFRSVYWFGETFTLTPKQAAVVELLWRSYEAGTPALGQHAVLAEIESDLGRLDHLFQRPVGARRAWKAMIERGPSRGTVQLRVPRSEARKPSSAPTGLPTPGE